MRSAVCGVRQGPKPLMMFCLHALRFHGTMFHGAMLLCHDSTCRPLFFMRGGHGFEFHLCC